MDSEPSQPYPLLSSTTDGVAELYQFDSVNSLRKIGTIGDGSIPVRDIALVLNVWTGAGGDANWTTAENWKSKLAPTPGSELSFPAGAARLTSVNDFPDGTTFGAIRWAADGYVVSGNDLVVDRSLFVSGGTVVVESDLAVSARTAAASYSSFEIAAESQLVLKGALDFAANAVVFEGLGSLELTGAVHGPGELIVLGSFLTVDHLMPGDVALRVNHGGTIDINHSSFASPVHVAGDGTLIGTGQLGELVVYSSGTVSPAGAASGSLFVQGHLNMHAASTLQIDLFGEGDERRADRLQVAGTVILDGTLELNANSDNQPEAQFTIVDNLGAEPVMGQFEGLPEGALIFASGHQYQISYQGGDGNDVVLTQLPDPKIKKANHSLQFTDVDGDLVTVSVSKGHLEPWRLQLHPVGDGNRFEFEKLDLSTGAGSSFDGANIKITAARKDLDGDGIKGDGFVNLGYLQAAGVNLGSVRVDGTLGGIHAGDASNAASKKKPVVKTLQAEAFGVIFGSLAAYHESFVDGDVQKFSIRRDFDWASLAVTGQVDTLTIGGSFAGWGFSTISVDQGIRKVSIGGSAYGEIRSDFGLLKEVKIGHYLESKEGTHARIFGHQIGSVNVKLTVLKAEIGSATQIGNVSIGEDLRDAVVFTSGDSASSGRALPSAIGKVTIGGEMERSRILAETGDSSQARIGSVLIRGNFVASNIAAGIDPVNGFYGDGDDMVMPGDDASLTARIAKITVRGEVIGTDVSGDSYGIIAERIGAVKLGKTVVPIAADAGAIFAFGPKEDVILRNVER